jgi:hypothetical protein
VGGIGVPLIGMGNDWDGNPLQAPAAYALASDDKRLWFIAHHRKPALLHPHARPGMFQAGLWHYDVAEFFLADPVSGRYFEFNLAPNGAWWSCEFTAPRVRAEEIDIAMPEVATFSDMAADGAWLVAMCIPLDLLKARLDFGTGTKANVTMILESPQQRFVSAVNLGGGDPDFHQPGKFSRIVFTPLG